MCRFWGFILELLCITCQILILSKFRAVSIFILAQSIQGLTCGVIKFHPAGSIKWHLRFSHFYQTKASSNFQFLKSGIFGTTNFYITEHVCKNAFSSFPSCIEVNLFTKMVVMPTRHYLCLVLLSPYCFQQDCLQDILDLEMS